MADLITALGLVLAVEGLLYAAFPEGMRKAMLTAAQTPADTMRIVGIVCAVAGVGLIWLMRG
ncbi:DUF2065 domain-containing protein [Salinarimonas sp.]|uniref:DUF2065 domain-containing protein n=1 Tax=Salinarimonas sp. TaxID=2766526 RepID=UPI00391D4465